MSNEQANVTITLLATSRVIAITREVSRLFRQPAIRYILVQTLPNNQSVEDKHLVTHT